MLQFQRPETLYRGQSNAAWDLKTNLERSCLRHDGSLDNADDREKRLRLLFVRHYHEHSQKQILHDDYLRWLALMQHHGAPTRLLDWSYSILVATYFAIEHATDDAAVWSIDNAWLRSSASAAFNAHGISESSMNVVRGRATQEEARERFNELFLQNKFTLVRAMSPFYRDTRLTAQQGTFICPGNVKISFMDNLNGMAPGTDGVTKYIIPRALHRDWLCQLYFANVTNSSLFPGLDGFSRMLNTFHPTAWDKCVKK